MDPDLGRFISRDTIGLWGDANNLGNPYSYVGNNPWSRLDPFGEMSGFLGFDAEGKGIQQPTIGETFEAIAEAHKVLVADPIRRLSPNPGPVAAALQSELLIVDRSGDIDLVENGNNAAYTTTQVILIVSPTKIFKVIKGAKNAVAGVRGARTTTMSVNSAEEGAEALGRIVAAGDKVEVLDNMADATRAGSNVKSRGDEVFRALREGEDPATGLRTRAPGTDTPVGSHVMGKRESDLISTTRDRSKAEGLFNSGNGVVAIDLSKVDAPIIDASEGIGRGRVHSRTVSHQEVLIRDAGAAAPPIPPEAIRVIEERK